MLHALLVPFMRSSVIAAVAATLLLTPSCLAQTPREQVMQSRDHLNKGNYYLGRRQFPDAIQEYESALQLDPTNTAAKDNIVLTHNNWGIVFFSEKKYDDARKEWQTALQLDPYNKLAKHNIAVLDQTLARAGQGAPAAGGKDGAAKAAADKKDKSETSAVMVLTPGLKQSKVSSASAADSAASQSPAASQPTGAATSVYGSDTVPADNGTPFDTPPSSAAGSTMQAPPSSGTSGTGSLEDLLSAVEMKIYGQTQTGMPVIKRLERIETDSTGQVHTGSIKERIDSLRKSYNL